MNGKNPFRKDYQSNSYSNYSYSKSYNPYNKINSSGYSSYHPSTKYNRTPKKNNYAEDLPVKPYDSYNQKYFPSTPYGFNQNPKKSNSKHTLNHHDKINYNYHDQPEYQYESPEHYNPNINTKSPYNQNYPHTTSFNNENYYNSDNKDPILYSIDDNNNNKKPFFG
ncbi:hypothetical protein BCR36DRAFT_586481, partial [Piromyces finnis]